MAWELRTAWAKRTKVALVIDADITHVQGIVKRVSPTDAFVLMDDGKSDFIHIPINRIQAVRKPHFHEPNDGGKA